MSTQPMPAPAPQQQPVPQQVVYVTAPAPQHKRTNHVLHAILTVITGGVWGIVWLVQVLRHRNV